ncbi:MAG: hypothetical protein F9K25_08480 [Candidatus Contendobacter sp.]|nr:MAG: hypothetical protein F9K25_08480 [Candidatus Contendobacter sp.]
MAKRPIFVPKLNGSQMVVAIPIEFTWHAGMSKSQKQKSIRSLHEAAKKSRGIENVLEISSKSEDKIGIQLSAFNLMFKTANGNSAPVEVLFQGSKVFSDGGPYTDIYQKTSREAKADERLKTSGQLIMFQYEGFDWSLNPKTVFYDWLYLSALKQNISLAKQLLEYDGFSDIEFNPEKSINCQASSAALYKALVERKLLEFAFSSPENFIRISKGQKNEPVNKQEFLF